MSGGWRWSARPSVNWADTYDRYAGTSGRQQGEAKESSPARTATRGRVTVAAGLHAKDQAVGRAARMLFISATSFCWLSRMEVASCFAGSNLPFSSWVLAMSIALLW